MAPTVSIALCTFNGGEFLVEQLGSILAQHSLPDEIVLSDDGSTDGTIGLLEAFRDRAAVAGIPTTVLRKDAPAGVTANFARAIAACTGDLVILCDQDDVWLPERISRARAAFAGDPALLLLHGDARLVDAHGAPLGTSLFAALGVRGEDLAAINGGAGFDRYLRRNLATGATLTLRRTLFDVAAPIPAEWVHDEWLAIVAAATGRVAATGEQLVDYRQHGQNQIGVRAPTLAYRIRRMLGAAPDRNLVLARRSVLLSDRLATLAGVVPAVREAAAGKSAFEAARAAMPRLRIARIPRILALVGGYPRFASQGRLDMLRDLLRRPDRG